ncbi:MAG: DUF1778 domain-containing protein [Mesorhizobium sp.]
MQTTKADLIKARISGADKGIILEAARRRGQSISEFIRATALKAAGMQ